MKALLVDLDDTLLDYTGGVDECWLYACEAHAGPVGTGAPMHGPTAFGFLEFDWNGALPGFSPWRGDATTADIFPHQANATE